MPLMSIVIPVYNVENYLEECLQSIFNQIYDDYEVILVDNGSTDKSGEICDTYASKYNNIKVIHLAVNSLPAGARNVGIDAAEGEYIHFCDSDDYYVDDSFTIIAKTLNQCMPDVLVGQFICKPEKGAFVCSDFKFNLEVFKNSDTNVIVQYLLNLPKTLCTPWRFICKRKFLVSNNLKFLEGYHFEDVEWFPRVICCADKFALLTEPFYCYRPRANGSITSKKTYIISKSQLAVIISLLRFLDNHNYKDIRRDFTFSHVKSLLGLFVTRCDTFSREQLHELADLIESNLDFFNMLSEVSRTDDLYSFVSRYGSHMGLSLYRTYVIERTLEKVYGKEISEIYIFPTGYNGEGTARILQNSGYNVKGFLDNSESKDGCTIDGLPVNLPSILKEFPDDRLRNTFVVVTIQQEHIAKVIMDQLRELGLDNSQFTSRIY